MSGPRATSLARLRHVRRAPRTLNSHRPLKSLCVPRFLPFSRQYTERHVFEPFYPLPDRKAPDFVTADEAVRFIPSASKVFIHGGVATPQALVDALARRGIESDLYDVELMHIHTSGKMPVTDEYAGIFRSNSFFVGANCRSAVNAGLADFTPVFLSEIPNLFRRGLLDVDAALIQVSPPDRHGYCTLGVSVDCARAAVSRAQLLVGQVNERMPRTHGDGAIHVTHFDYLTEHHTDLPQDVPDAPTVEHERIGHHIAGLVEDGSTLQLGIGAIPNAVLASLTNHRDLGLHTEMCSDGIVPLVEKGVITNSKKRVYPGKIVSSFVVGTNKIYDFIHDNPYVAMLDCSFVNDTDVIRTNPKVVAVNSCIEIDLTGQIVSDSIGTKIFSGVGGQLDFIRGASLCPDGKPIIAFPSRTSHGKPRIVPFLQEGAGVVTTRAHVHWVVTEYGAVNLFGVPVRRRAELLISISHPDDREELAKAAHARFGRIHPR